MHFSELFSVDLPTRRATTRLAQWLSLTVRGGDLVVLAGGLGVGKTFLVRAVARRLGLDPSERVTSPTFALVRVLDTTPQIVHADLYRLTSDAEVEQLGLAQMRGEGAVLFVEWGETYLEQLGSEALVVALAMTKTGRKATVGWYGSEPDAWQHLALPSNLEVRLSAKTR